jgi:hypothetical protein|tara:strand:- start:4 stop:216 length:213 start_codon:yes stop_codon:yes gene_type:complete
LRTKVVNARRGVAEGILLWGNQRGATGRSGLCAFDALWAPLDAFVFYRETKSDEDGSMTFQNFQASSSFF